MLCGVLVVCCGTLCVLCCVVACCDCCCVSYGNVLHSHVNILFVCRLYCVVAYVVTCVCYIQCIMLYDMVLQ